MSLAAPESVFAAIETEIKQKLETNSIDVPMLPEVAGRVMRVTQDPDSDASVLAKLIQSDQTLAGHVMRVANSAAYSPNSSMVSLQQAIARLGMQTISEIALSASINSSLFNAPGFETHIATTMKCALFSALWAKEIARICRRNVEAAFIAGLLHDIGKPVAVQTITEAAKKLKISLSKNEILALEKSFQREFGIKVVEQWDMPESVIATITYFDRYKEPHNTAEQTMIAVAGAKFVSHFMCEPDITECLSLEELKIQPIFGDLDLYQNDIEKLIEQQEKVQSALEAMSV